MTIERPMFPPRADECVVFDFASFALAAKVLKAAPESSSVRKARMNARRDQNIAKRKAKLLEATTAPETLTETCVNSRLRLARRDAWWTADRLTDFARAHMDWHGALSCAQSWNVPRAGDYPEASASQPLVDAWRAALVAQLLTPAPDLTAVAWKQVKLGGEDIRHINIDPRRIERAIAADEAWLAAHPSKRSKPMSDEKRRNAANSRRQCAGASRTLPHRATFRTMKSAACSVLGTGLLASLPKPTM